MSFDKILGDLSQGLRRRGIRGGAPRRLEANILARLPESVLAVRSLLIKLGVVGGLGAVCVAGAGVVALSHHVRLPAKASLPSNVPASIETPVSLEEAKVRVAVDRTNLWHFTEVQNYPKSANFAGQLFRHETWERRSPFFYREDGYTTTIDDGRVRTLVIPPGRVFSGIEPAKCARWLPGRIFLLPSTRTGVIPRENLERLLMGSAGAEPQSPRDTLGNAETAIFGGGSAGERLLLPDADATERFAKPVAMVEKWFEYKEERNFKDSYSRYTERLTLNPLTHLPSRYRSEDSVHEAPIDTQRPDLSGRYSSTRTIDVDYNGVLPSTVTCLEARPGYAVIDLRRISAIVAAPGAPGPTDGVQVRAESLARDSSGNYYVRLQNHLSFRPELLDGIGTPLSRFTAHDDAGNVYVCVPISEGGQDPNLTTLIVSPLDPNKTKVSGPVPLKIHIAAMFGSSWPLISKQSIPLSFSLPVNQNIPRASLAETSVIPNSTNPPSTVRELIAMARAEYFGSGNLRDSSHSAYWWDVAADEAERLGAAGAARQYRSRANLYRPH